MKIRLRPSTTLCSQKPSVCVPPSKWENGLTTDSNISMSPTRNPTPRLTDWVTDWLTDRVTDSRNATWIWNWTTHFDLKMEAVRFPETLLSHGNHLMSLRSRRPRHELRAVTMGNLIPEMHIIIQFRNCYHLVYHFFFFILYPFWPLERWGGGSPRPRIPLHIRITIYSRQVISLALQARYLGQLDSQYLYPLGSPGGPAIPPGTGCSF
jgi:hypothetical protein